MFRWLKRLFGREVPPLRELTPEEIEAESERRRNIRGFSRRLCEIEDLDGLSNDEAKVLFLEGIQVGAIYVVFEPATDTDMLKDLPELTRELFMRVAHIFVEVLGQGVYRETFNREYYPGFLYIADAELTAYLIKLGSDEVYIFDHDDRYPGDEYVVENDQVVKKRRDYHRTKEEVLRDLEPSHPTVYHWALDMAAARWNEDEDEEEDEG